MDVLTFIKLLGCIAELSHAVASQCSIRVFVDLAYSGSLTSFVFDSLNWLTEGKVESTRRGERIKAGNLWGLQVLLLDSKPVFLPECLKSVSE